MISYRRLALNSVKSALRVADILEIVSAHPPGLTFSELLETSQLPKSSLHELLTTMTQQRLLTYNHLTKRYSLGSRIWEWASTWAQSLQIVPVAWPYLQTIRNELNETVQLAILDQGNVMYVAKVESSHPLQLASHVGIRLPAYATGIGQAILAALPKTDVTRLYPDKLPTYTSLTTATLQKLLDKLDVTRIDGYATDWGEYSPDIRCVAVPILGMNNHVMAAVSISVPKDRFSSSHRDRMVQTITHYSRLISHECGATDPEAWRTPQ